MIDIEDGQEIAHYTGNPRLRALGAQVDYTAAQMSELLNCALDIHYFIKNYCKTIHVDRGVIPFVPYGYQDRMIDSMVEHNKSVIIAPRQHGKTLSTAAVILWYIIFTKKYTVACLAHKEAQAIEVLDRVKDMYMELPLWMQHGVSVWNRKRIKLENGSQVRCAATTSGSIRGLTLNMIYCDEFAHIPPRIQQDFYAAVLPTISSGESTKIIMTSTPKGFELFYKTYNDAINGKNNYNPVTVHWNEHPEHDDAWAARQLADLGEEKFRQEFGIEFLGSSLTLIRSDKLKSIIYNDPIQSDDYFSVFQQPQPSHVYTLSVDCSDGVNRDYNTFIVMDVTQIPYKVVATYRNNVIELEAFSDIISRVGRWYNEAFVVVENNNMGGQVASSLFYDLEYENMFSTTKESAGNAITEGFRQTLGLNMNRKTKRVGCMTLKTLIENDQIFTESWEILHELTRFVRHKTSYAAESGEHDDLVMCLVSFAWITTQPYFKSLTNTDLRRELMAKKAAQIEEAMMSFGVIDNGQTEEVLVVDLVHDDFDRFMMS